MAQLSKFSCEEHEKEGSLLELVKSYRCRKCEGRQFSCLITMEPGDHQSGEFVNVSIWLECSSCKRVAVVHPVATAGTLLQLYVGHGTDISVALYKLSVKATRQEKRRTSTEHRYSKTKNGEHAGTSSSRTRKGKR